MKGMDRAALFCSAFDRYVLTTHEGLDADGLGAELLLEAALCGLGKRVRIFNSGPVPELYLFMDPEGHAKSWHDSDEAYTKGAALLVVDCADDMHLGKTGISLLKSAMDVFYIDHHHVLNSDALDRWVDETAASASELALALARNLGLKLTPTVATAAYTGIAYDTGFFAYPKTSERTLQAAAFLVGEGAEPNRVFQALRESYSANMLLLQKRVMSNLRLIQDGRIAFLFMSQKDISECGARYEDAENFVNWPLSSRDVEVAAFFKEAADGSVRCSLRSKGGVNVAHIARFFNGGGHRTAAGFRCHHGPRLSSVELCLILERYFKKTDYP